ncbi:MAG: DUF5801 domain-containing protein, partial [Phycisphaerae bacterium]|nr:DUF5801 domain-containing protein [Phycisphaerae bacterium]
IDGMAYFTITVSNTNVEGEAEGEVTFTQILNVWHEETGDHDDTSTLETLGIGDLQIRQALTDANGDMIVRDIPLGGTAFPVFEIEDDGPDAVVVNDTPDTLVLDETRPVGEETDGNGTPAGLDTVTADFADNFSPETGIDYGADGAGSTAYALSLSADGIGSGLYALDSTDTETDVDPIGQGDEILLNQSGDTVTGSVGGTNYFTISIAPGTGVVTFTQLNNIWHGNTTSDDDTSTLTLDGEGEYLRVVQTVTDADGDSDSAAIDLGTGVFSIEDDGPDQVVFNDLDGEVTTVVQTVDPGWSGSPGTDGLGTLIVTAADSDSDPSNGITFDMLTADDIASTGTVDSFAFDEMDGRYEGTLTADFDNDASNGEETIGFTLSVNSDGTYDFQLDQVIVPVVTLSTDEGQLPAGGPDPVQTLTFDTTEVVFFAVDAATAVDGTSPIVPAIVIGELDNPGLEATTEASLEAGAAPPIGDNTFSFIREEIKMNVSTTGIGVGNNVFQGYDPNGGTDGSIDPFNPDDLPTFDESFVINPEPLASSVKVFISKTAGGFLPPNDDGTLQGTAAKTDYLYYNAYDEMGIATEPILVTSDIVFDEADEAAGGTGENLWSFTVSIDDVNLEGLGDAIDAIQFTMGFGDIKIPKIEIVVRGDVPPNDIFLDFSAKLTDADGDMGAPGTFEINLLAPAEPEGTSASSSTLASESEVDLIAEAYPILNLDGADEEEAADEKKDKDNTSAKRIRGVLNDGVDLLAV